MIKYSRRRFFNSYTLAMEWNCRRKGNLNIVLYRYRDWKIRTWDKD